uniref:CCHC-type domain-containing protein n=1 Tax=Knipowitschia caucasica TaxID=637954 RepID=A0AAV2KDW3_KNICA
MLYLKTYLADEAKKAVEGYFFRNSDQAYQGIWDVLEESDESHGIVKCPNFAAKASDEKTTFIRENHLCFGCLRKGHVTKECKVRHSCEMRNYLRFLCGMDCFGPFVTKQGRKEHKSHAGGVWERQIRTIRNVLNASISQHVYGYHPRQRVGSEAEGGCIPLMSRVMRVCHLRQGPSPYVHNLHGR